MNDLLSGSCIAVSSAQPTNIRRHRDRDRGRGSNELNNCCSLPRLISIVASGREDLSMAASVVFFLLAHVNELVSLAGPRSTPNDNRGRRITGFHFSGTCVCLSKSTRDEKE